ncbi:FxLYD domain-containing protein [Aquibacillus koreensis]|uniref:FxLYD domain-containing protein n=1 Tax=Aquibacillus koreensis TaxID=279446 RepID=A0A9X4AKB7_9BACI|nr:FxLYD domain-containing protein [Aquibacillus koreensis]MCT2537911.1 FxLYD domain-containing protein [Aquibacillus koreensis]MDC3422679.1 FxLYD domain-containing protein [Aquibacillus koreensis]
MFCHQCGEKITESAKFCSSCGAQIDQSNDMIESEDNHIESQSEISSKTPEEPQERVIRSKQKLKKGVGFWIATFLPIVSLVCICAGLIYFYIHQLNVNDEVLAFQKSAEAAALQGDYETAEESLVNAIDLRPNYAVLGQDLEEIERVSSFLEELETIQKTVKKQNFSDAEELLTSFKEKLQTAVGPLFEPIHPELTTIEVTITVGKIKQELDELTTVDALAAKLNTLATLSSEEAAAVKKQIINKIVKISSGRATTALDNNQFSDARSIINEALSYATDDEKLLAFLEKIDQEQTAFETAEQERLEQAMEVAAQEDLHNRTAAVEVLSFESHIDEYGDFYFSGEIKNVATTEINEVTIYYTIYDAEGAYITDSFTSVYPYYIGPGETGTFEDFMYHVSEDATIEIDDITWYLD